MRTTTSWLRFGFSRRTAALGLAGVGAVVAVCWLGEAPPSATSTSALVRGTPVRPAMASKKLDYVARLAARGGAAAATELASAYVTWAQDPTAIEAREDILAALLAVGSVPLRLKAVLDAVAGDPTPPADDPLWTTAVDGLERTWLKAPAFVGRGQDLMLAEPRPRARQLLAMSLARAAQSGLSSHLSEAQRFALSADLIDVYFEPTAQSYRPDLIPGVRALTGADTALLLERGVEGVRNGGLAVVQRDNAAVEAALSNLARGEGKLELPR